MKKFALLIAIVMCMFFVKDASAITTADIDGTFGAEWNGHFVDTDGIIERGGGQPYDSEKFGLVISDATNEVFFGLQTGFDLINGYGGFHAGDFALDIGSDGTYEYAIDTTYGGISGTEPTFTLYDVATWTPITYPGNEYASPLEMATGTPTAGAAFSAAAYGTFNDVQGPHYVLEGSFNLDALSYYTAGDNVTMHWVMSCGNDVIEITRVPEPATLLLIGSGLIGLGVFRKKFKV